MDWAFIAGGSKGIGLAMAEALARRGFHLILAARNEEDLRKAKALLETRHGIQSEICSVDLSLAGATKKVSEWCKSKTGELKVFCYAAGLGGSRDFPLLDTDALQTMISLNLQAAVLVCQELLPLLKNARPSHILLTASMAGFAPIPAKNVYSSTKTALLTFSYSLNQQLKNDGISVSCLCPGPVFTKPAIEKETLRQLGWMGRQMAVPPDEVGEYAIKEMLRGKLVIIPGWLNRLLSHFLRFMPRRSLAWIYHRFGKPVQQDADDT